MLRTLLNFTPLGLDSSLIITKRYYPAIVSVTKKLYYY